MSARIFPFFLCATLALTVPPAAAIDSNGNYAPRGIGMQTCAQYIEAKQAESSAFDRYYGWIDGFLSAVNFYEERTFDIAPWQSTDLIAVSLGRYCAANKDLAFHTALSRLVIQLGSQRLATLSPRVLVTGDVEGEGVQMALYGAILERTQIRLKAAGFYRGDSDGSYNEATKIALRSFQRKRGLRETGLPDQATLLLLLDENAAQ